MKALFNIRTIFYLTLSVLCIEGNAQSATYSWAGYTAGSLTYTTGIMQSAITASNVKAWGNGYSSPQYHSNTSLGSGTCGITGGLGLEIFFGNTTNAYIQQVIDFTSNGTTNGTCASMTFSIGDINTSISVGFGDIVQISAMDGNGSSITPVVSGSGMTITGTTTKTITGNEVGSTCNVLAVSITPPAGVPLNTITIKYYPNSTNGCNTSGYYNFTSGCTSNGTCGSCFRPALQFISISAITATATSGCVIIMPIELISFSGKCDESGKTFQWTTQTEANNKGFILEHSKDGDNFEVVGNIKGSSKSTSRIDYTYTLKNEDAGYNYYRLKQTDLDGKTQILKTIYLSCIDKIGNIKLFPNPANEKIKVQFNSPVDEIFDFNITDISGRIIRTGSFSALSGENEASLDISDLPKGSYNIVVSDNAGTSRPQTLKFVKIDN